MEVVVDRRRENKLLEREEIHCRVKYDGSTPARKKVKDALKSQLGVSGYIVIQKIEPLFGMKEAKVYAKIYPNEEVARKIESRYVFKRGGGKGEVKEEKKEAAPAEEKEEEKKEEGGEESKGSEEGEENAEA